MRNKILTDSLADWLANCTIKDDECKNHYQEGKDANEGILQLQFDAEPQHGPQDLDSPRPPRQESSLQRQVETRLISFLR